MDSKELAVEQQERKEELERRTVIALESMASSLAKILTILKRR